MRTQRYRLNTIMILCGILAIRLVLLSQPAAASPSATDSVGGDWTVHFEAMGHSVPGKLHLEVDSERLTGTIETAHTGPGKIQDGKWTNNKLACTLVFERHESIVFEGERKTDGTLSGQYKTEGRTETWRAERGANR